MGGLGLYHANADLGEKHRIQEKYYYYKKFINRSLHKKTTRIDMSPFTGQLLKGVYITPVWFLYSKINRNNQK